MSIALRNPLQLAAVVILGVAQSFMLVVLYHGCGAEEPESNPYFQYKAWKSEGEKIIGNWLGLVFLATTDQFIICTFAMVLMIPSNYPVYRREMGSHMYSASSYFTAATFSNIATNIFYPILVSLLTFFFYDYPISDFGGFLAFFAVEASAALAGICYGQVIGSFITTEYAAMTWLMQSLTIYYLGAGMLTNAGSGSNWFGDFLQWISPLRYLNELAMRRMLAGRDD